MISNWEPSALISACAISWPYMGCFLTYVPLFPNSLLGSTFVNLDSRINMLIGMRIDTSCSEYQNKYLQALGRKLL